ncbi:hypothetical protein Peur_043932 [Populus x canadensis]
MLTSTSQLFSSSFFIAINQGYRSKELAVPFQASKNSSTYLKFFAHIVAQARPVVVRCSLKPSYGFLTDQVMSEELADLLQLKHPRIIRDVFVKLGRIINLNLLKKDQLKLQLVSRHSNMSEVVWSYITVPRCPSTRAK